MKKIKEILDKVLSVLTMVIKILDVFTRKTKQKQMDKKKNEIFNDKLNSKDTSICDAIRKDKQKKINSLKTCILFTIIMFTFGCINIKPQPNIEETTIESIDIHQLKTEDKTYKIVDKQQIKVFDKSEEKDYVFTEDWFVVHSDILKSMNENQDLLIQQLEEKKIKSFPLFILLFLAILLIIFGILKFFKK